MPEPYPGYRKEARAAADRAHAMRQAAAEPLPGPLLEAFAGVPAHAGGLQVRPLVSYDWVILKRINSPLIRQLAAVAAGMKGRRNGKDRKGKRAETEWSDEQGYEMIYQFTRPAEELHRFFERHGAAAPARFRSEAIAEIGLKLRPLEVAALVPEVVRQFVASFDTRVLFEPKDPDGGFPSPPPGATASAGGSITSAASSPSTISTPITSSIASPSPKASP